jgi:glycosyltransferase involved in cell wall biosynthesis
MVGAEPPQRQDGPGLVSVVVPVLNEAETIEPLYERLRSSLSDFEWELIAVDDGSTDATNGILERLADADSRVRVLTLSRNFGHQAALTAGLDNAKGGVVVTMDADLQDPPELIATLVDRWREGADVVHAVRGQRPGEPRWRMTLIRSFYRLFTRFSRIELVANAGDFRLIDRRALDVIAYMRERNRFLRGMSVWVGFRQASVTYDREVRHAGETKYPLHRLLELAFDGLVAYSYAPLRVAAAVGTLFSVAALIGIPVVIALKIAGSYVPGIASITIVVLLLGGIQLLTLGVMGEYLGRSYEEVKARPIYIVRASKNLPDAELVGGPFRGPEPADTSRR